MGINIKNIGSIVLWVRAVKDLNLIYIFNPPFEAKTADGWKLTGLTGWIIFIYRIS